MRNISLNGRRNILATSPEESLLIMLEISHPDLTSPVRIVNDTQDLVSQGLTFSSCPFAITLPDDAEGQLPQATLQVDNVDQALMGWLEVSRGGQGAKCRILMVSEATPNIRELDMLLDLTSISANNLTVSAQLGFVNTLGRSAVAKTFNPQSAPGLW
ncbi:DUF1833 family protein [Schauerella aestuarii]|uniref:DUF1833 family protein n=1 Tax=Schauerella aestuarii TaxID=2511204 RepID=UPI00136FECB6|nr:DUF1833 family protein [Achromobacter aestuarii]MYZ41425.1 DUF1833 domain-containing protein [Achromobacter aestuarii]